jgi:hypothetical protein
VLREKEMHLVRVRIEVEALRRVAPLLADPSAGPGAAPSDSERVQQPDTIWTPALPKNKWPLKAGDPAPTYSDS